MRIAPLRSPAMPCSPRWDAVSVDRVIIVPPSWEGERVAAGAPAFAVGHVRDALTIRHATAG